MSRNGGERRSTSGSLNVPILAYEEDEEEIDEEDEAEEFQQESSSSDEAPGVDETVVADEKIGVGVSPPPPTTTTTLTREDEEEAIREALRAKYAARRPVPVLEKKELPPPPPIVRVMPMRLPPPPKTGTGLVLMHPGTTFIDYVPPRPEPYHTLRPGIAQEMLQREAERMSNPYSRAARPVFELPADAMQLSSNPTPTVVPSLPPMYTPMSPDDHTLVFESRFESGNLKKVTQVGDYEYDLWLKYDVNTRRHTQWYFFSVSNTRRGITYKFNIVNLMKPDSLYNMGLRPLVYSTQNASRNGIGWVRGGDEICYYQNLIKRKTGAFYTFTFSYCFDYDHDTVYFAYCYPYTYTQLNMYLNELESNPETSVRFRRRTLCQTIAGNNCDLLTITSFACDPEDLKSRKGIVITARVHPGESNASLMMKGVIDFLTGPSLEAKMLRDQFVFKVIPMMNPDGVINGNYRCSLAGCDLNRRWDEPSKKMHPTIFCAKMMIKRFMEDREVLIFCDLHGHSRKNNIFIYGCDARTGDFEQRLRERVFPKILHNNSAHFNFRDCSFKVHKSKESTARVVLWKECGLHNSYTMEASFAGADFGPTAHMHFNSKHLEDMGRYLCLSILDYADPNPSRVNAILRELEIMFPPPPGTITASALATMQAAAADVGGAIGILNGFQPPAAVVGDGNGLSSLLGDRSAASSVLGIYGDGGGVLGGVMSPTFLDDDDDSSIGSDDTPASDPEDDKRKRRKAKRKKSKRSKEKGDKEKPKKAKDSDQEKSDKGGKDIPKKAKAQLLAKINSSSQLASAYERMGLNDATPAKKKGDPTGKPPLTSREISTDWKNSLRSTGPPPPSRPSISEKQEIPQEKEKPEKEKEKKKKPKKLKSKKSSATTTATATAQQASSGTTPTEPLAFEDSNDVGALSDHGTRASTARKSRIGRPTSASGLTRRYKTDDEGYSIVSAAATALALASGLTARSKASDTPPPMMVPQPPSQPRQQFVNPPWEPDYSVGVGAGPGRPSTRMSKSNGKALVPTVYRADVAMGLVADGSSKEELPRIGRRSASNSRPRPTMMIPPELF